MLSQEKPQSAVHIHQKTCGFKRLCVRSEIPSSHFSPSSNVAASTDNKKQDTQCTYNVILRRVRATIFAVKSKKCYIFRAYICSLKYPACNADVPYYIVICGFPGSVLFFHIISSIEKYRNKNISHKIRVLIFSTTFV